jgi:predicted metal-dependent phosphoesterase TrpH
VSRCDLHIHSRHSARSEEWLFRRFDFPDSYSDPKQLYEQLLKRGMDYVTLTDHDSIDGCLEIAHLPRTFICIGTCKPRKSRTPSRIRYTA